jgi:transposase
LFIRQQTSVINAIRAHLAEFGIVAPVGRNGVEQLLAVAADLNDKRLPEIARTCVAALGAQLRILKAQILEFDRMIAAWHRSGEASGRSTISPASVRHWRLLWLPASLIRGLSGQEGTSRPGSGSCRSRTRAEARTGSAVLANEAIVTCGACSQPARSPSSAMPKSMAPGIGLGLRRC